MASHSTHVGHPWIYPSFRFLPLRADWVVENFLSEAIGGTLISELIVHANVKSASLVLIYYLIAPENHTIKF